LRQAKVPAVVLVTVLSSSFELCHR
jgi:hypothetical protein